MRASRLSLVLMAVSLAGAAAAQGSYRGASRTLASVECVAPNGLSIHFDFFNNGTARLTTNRNTEERYGAYSVTDRAYTIPLPEQNHRNFVIDRTRNRGRMESESGSLGYACRAVAASP